MAHITVNKDGMNHVIEEEWLPSFLEDGWSKGAAKKPKQSKQEQNEGKQEQADASGESNDSPEDEKGE